MKKRGLLFIISGPAGSGKGTIVKRVRELAEFDFSVSATTRAPRPGETEGVHYFFTDKEEFKRKIAAGEMLEHAEYVGNYYGTPKKPVDDALSAGKNIILDIDVQGALQVKTKMPEAVMIFVLPPDFETLMRRIRGRGTESEEIIAKRMEKARFELQCFDRYDYAVVNRDNGVEEAAGDVLSILKAETLKTFRNTDIKDNFFQ
ncbi:MAG: guanylate kinase [Clostridiales bacterium]|nr:guanylate kinase [Clostridiales bacterium]